MSGNPRVSVLTRQLESLLLQDGGESGGQGKVRLLQNDTSLVYKEFHDPTGLDRGAMDRILRLPQTLNGEDRHRLLSATAWPRERVDDGSRFVGFLMPKIPDNFWYEDPRAGRRLLEFQHLMFPVKASRKAVPNPSTPQRLQILRSAANIFAFLHRHSFIVGDVSMKNIVWSVNPTPQAFLIDCDGCRKLSYPPVLQQADTPEWEDPLQPHNTATEASDRYKLALLIGRGLNVRYTWRPSDPHPFAACGGLSDRQRDTLTCLSEAAAGPTHLRPAAAEWAAALSDRPAVRVRPPLRPSPAPATRVPPTQTRPQRPTIRLRRMKVDGEDGGGTSDARG